MKEKNIFEKIINREISADILYEDQEVIAFLDIFPYERGHMLVVPKKVYRYIWEMPEDEYLNLQKVILKMIKKIESEMNCGLNILQNNKKIAGQVVPHVHFHLVPRVEEKNIYSGPEGNAQYVDDEERKKYLDMLKFDN